MALFEMTVHELHELLKQKKVSSLEITNDYLKRIKNTDDSIKSFITVTKEEAISQAKEADEIIRSGDDFDFLTGIPIGIKDLISTAGIRTTCGSKILENYIPPYDATVIRKLKEKHPVIIGKLNMDEFAMGSSTETSYYGNTKNPWDIERIPGGSSGGSASSVSARQCSASLGSDTGGSIRQPAACCGVVGFKPTYGRVSRFGLIAFASSLDQIGPLTKDVEDCAIMLNAICGNDPADSTSTKKDVPDFTKDLVNDVKGMKVGIPKEYFIEGIDSEVSSAVNDSIELFKKLGATIVDISLPHTKYAVSVYYIIATAEASSNLARYDGVKYGFREETAANLRDMYFKTRSKGFGAEVKRRIMLGTYVLSSGYYDAYYLRAQKVRTLITNDFKDAFKKCDIILTPTAPTPAFKIGEKTSDPLKMYLSDIFTISANLAGICGVSIPCGFTNNGLPVGLQLMGNHFDESSIIRAAYAFEQNTDYHKKTPKL
jgi:aspartyl-tRNA(Asn)/glutamyl-tRNA(Gln) amidotransferase subunit A